MKINVVFGLLISVLVMSGCTILPENTWVTKIKELKGEHPLSWQLKYDDLGRLSGYGQTPISYDINEIRIGETNWAYKEEQLLSATYSFEQGKVSHSEARCLWVDDSTEIILTKKIDYKYIGDTLQMDAYYHNAENHQFFRQVIATYIPDSEGNLAEIISHYTDKNGKASACHSYYTYLGNIDYTANLNLQPFFTDVEGPDVFYFFLLNMNGTATGKKLPTRIRYCVNQGQATYKADGLYRLKEDFLQRGEIISDDVKVKARLEFEYYQD